MEVVFLQYVLWGVAGAAAAEVLEYYSSRQRNRRFNVVRAAVIVAASGLVTALYFTEVDLSPSGWLTVFQYGVFLALTIEEIVKLLTSAPELVPAPRHAAVLTTPAAGGVGLVLDGFLSVFAVGCAGAFTAEFMRIRRKVATLTGMDWIMSAIFVVISGLITVMHGVEHISALTALQLGAAGPLVVTRLKP